jgi:hypothetical protein
VQLSSGTAAIVNYSSAAAMDALQRFALALNEHPHPLAVPATAAELVQTMHDPKEQVWLFCIATRINVC